jgi:uncharacterized protein involved in exopolysaccharide biosynthesis
VGTIQTLADVIGLIRRRMLLILAIALPGALISLHLALGQAHVWESAAVIQIETPQVLDPARDLPTATTSQRLQLIEQRLLSRQALLDLIARHGLFADQPALTESERVARMRESIQLVPVAPGGAAIGGTDLSALVIVVRLGDPAAAAAVANEMAEAVIAMGAAAELARIDETLAFYTAEQARIADALEAAEARINAFKNENLESLPEALTSRREELGRLDERLREIDRRLLELGGERDAIAAGGTLREVERRRLAAIEAQIEVLGEERRLVSGRREVVEAALARAPAVEIELAALTRELQQIQEQYAVVVRRLAEAETSRKLAEAQQGERFTLLERAVPPEYPLRSARRRILALGVGLSGALALMLAFAAELLHPVLRTPAQMARAVGLTPVVAIPMIEGPGDVRRRQLRRLLGLAMIAAAALAAMAMLAAAAMPG